MQNQTNSPSPWSYIPSLYFASGVPFVIINTVSVIFYKKLGVDNVQIALWTSFIYLPWVIKMLWGPIVNLYSTKRTWILSTSLVMFLCLAGIAVCLQLANFFFISLVALTIGGFISVTYDEPIPLIKSFESINIRNIAVGHSVLKAKSLLRDSRIVLEAYTVLEESV